MNETMTIKPRRCRKAILPREPAASATLNGRSSEPCVERNGVSTSKTFEATIFGSEAKIMEIDSIIARLRSCTSADVEELVVEAALCIEANKAVLPDAVDLLLDALFDRYATSDVHVRSGIIWAIGKAPQQSGLQRLRRVFSETSVNEETDLLWQRLVAYENLVGHSVLSADEPYFAELQANAHRDPRLALGLRRFERL